MTASDPAETKDKERTETTPAEEAQQGIDLQAGGFVTQFPGRIECKVAHCDMNHQTGLN